MINSQSIDELASRLHELVPVSIQDAKSDLTDNFKDVLKGWLQQLDLVTREEFDAQKAVLLRTREKLETLEELVKSLES